MGDLVIGATDLGYTSFDAESGARLDDRPLAAGEALTAAAISPDGSVLAVGTEPGRLMVVELDGERVYYVDALPGRLGVAVESIAFDKSSRKLAFAGPRQRGAILWDLHEMRQIGSPLFAAPEYSGDAGPGGVMFVDDVLWVASTHLQSFDASTGEPLGTPSVVYNVYDAEVCGGGRTR